MGFFDESVLALAGSSGDAHKIARLSKIAHCPMDAGRAIGDLLGYILDGGQHDHVGELRLFEYRPRDRG